MATRRELKATIGQRYRGAGRRERRQIRDGFVKVTGYHRKHALRVLMKPPVMRIAQPRGRLYYEAVRQDADSVVGCGGIASAGSGLAARGESR